jgi:hypothetical protein
VPASFTTRCANGSIISTLVAPVCAMLKRMPRTPAVCRARSSLSVTLAFTTATPRVFLMPNCASASNRQRLSTPYVEGWITTLREVPMRFCNNR